MRVALISTALMLVGCSVNGLGATDTEIRQVDGGTVVSSQTYGLHVSTEPGEAGIVLGYSRSVRLLPGELPGISPGRYPLGVSLGDAKPVALFRQVVGLEIGFNDSTLGLSLGITEQMSTAPVDAGVTMTRRLFFVPDQPDRSMVQICEGSREC